jgi:predicted ribonuclease YlaK
MNRFVSFKVWQASSITKTTIKTTTKSIGLSSKVILLNNIKKINRHIALHISSSIVYCNYKQTKCLNLHKANYFVHLISSE